MEKSLVKFLKVKFLAVIFVFAALLASLSSCSGLSSGDAKKETGLKEKKTQLVKVQMSVEGINGSGSLGIQRIQRDFHLGKREQQ